jgi:hypothetical protein
MNIFFFILSLLSLTLAAPVKNAKKAQTPAELSKKQNAAIMKWATPVKTADAATAGLIIPIQ